MQAKNFLTIIQTGLSIIGFIFAGIQLWQIAKQLKIQVITTILTLESEMHSRKTKIDEICVEIEKLKECGDEQISTKEERAKVLDSYLQSAIENWLNAVDRLCFCILHDYLKEKEWKTEYRDYISKIVSDPQDKFGPSSLYTNIIDLNDRWKRS